ncbi:MAG: alpha/beta hydrolase, partial [Glaciimonas sp.]|nr:alpha/beta hydrolase [Glaciimonas sp.]
ELSTRYLEPVILLGHSMGGLLSLMVAKQHPELVRCVVLLDTPVICGWRAGLLGVAKGIGIDFKFSPARFSAKRRMQWPDAEAAYQHFASKDVFDLWPRDGIRDYVEQGRLQQDGNLTVRFCR